MAAGTGSGATLATTAGPATAGILGLLVLASVAALLFDAAARGLGPRAVAALGLLIAANSLLRLVEVALPGPGGFSPVFALVILAGRAFGPRLGFLTGAMSLAASALATGGLGPWLPYQMLVTGWVGQTAGMLPRRRGEIAEPAGGAPADGRRELWGLALFGAFWGILYGLILDLWAWTFLGPGVGAGQEAAIGGLAAFLLASLPWDAFRAAGNFALILLAGRPVLDALQRLALRLQFEATAVETRVEVGSDVDGETPEVEPELEARLDPNRSRAPHQAAMGLHPRAWLIWALALAVIASSSRHPLVLAGIGIGLWAIRRRLAEDPEDRGHRLDLPVGAFAIIAAGLAAAYIGLTLHQGAYPLARLPEAWPIVGGAITAEALAYGALTGLGLTAMLTAFICFQQAMSARQLVELVPRAFGTLGLALTVALSWLPSVGRQLEALREARAIRGIGAERGRLAALRAWPALAIPLLVGGLERSMHLADTLAARGLAGRSPARRGDRALFTAGLALLAGGWLGAGLGWLPGPAGPALLILGGLATLAALARAGRRQPRSAWRAARWRRRDSLVCLAAWLPLALRLIHPATRADWAWSPFPALDWPALGPALAVALLGPALPALLPAERRERQGLEEGGRSGPRRSGGIRLERPEERRREGSASDRPGVATHNPGATATAPPSATSAPGIRFDSWGYRYPDAAAAVLEGVDLDLPGGRLSLVAGPSGAGKTTLMQAMAGILPWVTGGEVAGRLSVGDGAAPMPGGRVGYVHGEPEAGFVVDRVADELAFALVHRGLPPARIEARIHGALEAVGLSGYAERRLETLSGGQRQRVAIAAALALEPDVLVLDEPTSQLDDALAAEVLDRLSALTAGGRRTVVVGEQRLRRVSAQAEWMVHVPGGGKRPRQAPAGALLASLPQPVVPPAPPLAPGAPVLELEGLSFRYPLGPGAHPESVREGEVEGPSALIEDLNLRLQAGEILALTGPSGVGKSTLLRLSVGLLAPLAGQVRVAGEDIAGRSVPEICRRVGYLPQDPSALLVSDRVRGELELTLEAHGLAPEDPHDPDRWLARLGIAELADRHPRSLSTGQRQRVALGAVLVTRPALILLDEPTRGLDAAAVVALVRLLHELAAGGAGILAATHDRRLMHAAHRHFELREEPAS